MTIPLISLDFACNNPDNGLFAGLVSAITITDSDGEQIELEANREFLFAVTSDHIRIHRRNFAFDKSREWLGNWCWNRYGFTWPEGKRLIHALRATGRWHCTLGEETFYHWFNEGLL